MLSKLDIVVNDWMVSFYITQNVVRFFYTKTKLSIRIQQTGKKDRNNTCTYVNSIEYNGADAFNNQIRNQ